MTTRTALQRAAGAACAFAIVLASRHASGQAESDPARVETFEYRQPARENHLRAVLQIQGVYAFGFLWYLTTALRRWDAGYRWQVYEQKLTTLPGHDDNGFGTNFRGHPLGGTSYYFAARGNRLGVGTSFGIAILGSLGWEYFGEVGEKVSLNDAIVTPVAGTAIGESFTQLGAYFDRASRSPWHQALGTLFGPVKTLNDALDGLELSRASGTAPEREWHDFPASVGFVLIREGGSLPQPTSTTSEARLSLSERLARLPGYDSASERSQWFDDAQLSGIAVSAAIAAHGLSDFVFEPHAVLVGRYWRSARGRGHQLRGGGTATGLRVGFSYQLHDYRREQAGPSDRSVLVEPLGWFLETRAAFANGRLRLSFDAGLEYGGVHPLALEQYRASGAQLPRTLQEFGYYFGAGARVRSQLELTLGDLRLDLSGAGLALGNVDERPTPPLSDGYARFGVGCGFAGFSGVTLRAFAESAQRFGRVGPVRVDASERALGAEGVAHF
jgi:hypothetical protein